MIVRKIFICKNIESFAMKSIIVQGVFLFCAGWNFSKSVSVGSTFIREMRVHSYVLKQPGLIIECLEYKALYEASFESVVSNY